MTMTKRRWDTFVHTQHVSQQRVVSPWPDIYVHSFSMWGVQLMHHSVFQIHLDQLNILMEILSYWIHRIYWQIPLNTLNKCCVLDPLLTRRWNTLWQPSQNPHLSVILSFASLSLSNSLILMTTVVIAVTEYATLNRIVARPTNLRPVNGGIFVIHAPISAKVAEYNHCCRFGWWW